MKVVFFGSPGAAIPSIQKIRQSSHSVELIITQPDRPSGRGKSLTPPPVKQYALIEGIPICQPQKIRKDQEVLDRLRSIGPDVNVVVAYGQLIPDSLIYLPRYNSINVHFSLLPKYRGASPVQWAILNGDSTTGLTVFELNSKMDEGDILSREEVDILPGETAFRLEKRLAERGADLLLDTLARIEEIKPWKQNHQDATYAPRIRKEDGLIDWRREAVSIYRQILAFTPWPSSYTHYDGKRIKILGGKLEALKTFRGRPGEIVKIDKDGIRVLCGQGSVLRIEAIQPENKAKMSAHAFSLGARLHPGQAFG